MFPLFGFRVVIIFSVIVSFSFQIAEAQQKSIAREWNEELLAAISRDLARPTVHARNLFHTSVVMYDAWAVYQADAVPFFLGKNIGGFEFDFDLAFSPPVFQSSIEQTISYAAYRLMLHRFNGSPGQDRTFQAINLRMINKGYDITNESTDYLNGGPAELGNYIASKMIEFGLQDGSNEAMDYANTFYYPANLPLVMDEPGNPDLVDINRWQPLTISDAVDQVGNPVESTLPFLSPEWGNVSPFSLSDEDLTIYERNGNEYSVFMDPGSPVFLDENQPGCETDLFKSGFLMVSIWQSHLDPSDTTSWDISPASIGNMGPLPDDWTDYEAYYDFYGGGDFSPGHTVNPATGQAYEPQFVRRGDYARILAEFWADGPDSETPPGHWFSIYNYVRDHVQFENKWMGEGPVLTNLEYDLKAYLLLGGAMHDAAIAAWSVKGYYDYIRPVSAIRYLGQLGQCSDSLDMSYDPMGFPLIPDYVEIVRPGDALEGDNQENVGKIKLYTWRGPDYIDDPETDIAGVGWILAEEWWPYQRPSFVTPPFAGFVSGHSTYSRAAAEVMTLMTGTAYFPGGMGEFFAAAGDFLEFENGPSEDIYLQWATYRDASDQTSLSRIWGGIHPPVDDIPGRIMGFNIGRKAVNYLNQFLGLNAPEVEFINLSSAVVNLENETDTFYLTIHFDRRMDIEEKLTLDFLANGVEYDWNVPHNSLWINDSTFQAELIISDPGQQILGPDLIIRGAKAWTLIELQDSIHQLDLLIDFQKPELNQLNPNFQIINLTALEGDNFILQMIFSEACQTEEFPLITFSGIQDQGSIFLLSDSLSSWSEDSVFIAVYNIASGVEYPDSIDITIEGVRDLAGNLMEIFTSSNFLFLDTRRPVISEITTNKSIINLSNIEEGPLSLNLVFSESCQTTEDPEILFFTDPGSEIEFIRIDSLCFWENDSVYSAQFLILAEETNLQAISIEIDGVKDHAENQMSLFSENDFLILDLLRPELTDVDLSHSLINVKAALEDSFEIRLFFNEACDISQTPELSFPDLNEEDFLVFLDSMSVWESDSVFLAVFAIGDEKLEISDLDLRVEGVLDLAGNALLAVEFPGLLNIDTRPPELLSVSASKQLIDSETIGEGSFSVTLVFNEPMNPGAEPVLEWLYSIFPNQEPLLPNQAMSSWEDAFTWIAVFDVQAVEFSDDDVGLRIYSATDQAENEMIELTSESLISIRLEAVSVINFDNGGILKLYPNPVKTGEMVSIELNETLSQITSYEILDLSGRIMNSTRKIVSGTDTLKFSTYRFIPGLYYIRLKAADSYFIKSFVVY